MNLVYVKLREKAPKEKIKTEKLDENIMLDRGEDGRIIGVEILTAKEIKINRV